MENPPKQFPMRINKYLAHKGVATRTGADELIKSGKVFINGLLAKLGDKISESDMIEIRGKHNKKNLYYFVYCKPKGTVTVNPKNNEKGIIDQIKFPVEVFSVGRLDKESEGLLIMTNDGRVTDRLLNPDYKHEKEYMVEVDRSFTPAFLKYMQNGVEIKDKNSVYKTRPATVARLSEKSFSIILTEGKNRQIRKMTEKLGYTVRNLKRIRVQNIFLGKLSPNSFREIKGEELSEFLKSIGL